MILQLSKTSICIILSGTGTDGTLGVKEIKANLGMVMVQDEKSSRYDGMPRSAIATGLADYVLPVEEMPKSLVKYTKHLFVKQVIVKDTDSTKYQKELNKIFILLRSQTNHDFSHYKKNTINRRIERRMHVHQIDNIQDYVAYLAKTQQEVHVLFKDLLIGVTSFFRDPEAFENLKNNHIVNMLKSKPDDYKVRVWIAGCSSGEEAYSIAILIQESMEQIGRHFEVQIFGTDIDEDAINSARTGVYPLSISTDISPDRLKRYFTKEENMYRVKKSIREMLIFAPQNLIKDPPFTKLDLLSCRNLLIYLSPELQKRVLPVFQYSLKGDGILFLGSSESIGQAIDLFRMKDKKWKIFECETASKVTHPILDFPLPPKNDEQTIVLESNAESRTADINNLKLVETILEQSDTPPCAIVDAHNDIIYIHGRTGKYLEPAVGKISVNILEMARPGLKAALAAIIRKATTQNQEIIQKGVEVQGNGGFKLVDIIVKPLQEWGAMRGLLMVAFQAVSKSTKKGRGKQPVKDKALAKVEQELQYTKENLQTTIEELETSNEELKSTNEELQSTNEELQSTNEELETSKEELQSLNEESATVNAELQSRIDELSATTDDMKNLLDSTQIATIFLDIDLCIRRFTPTVTQLIPLSNGDVGRPITHFATQLKDVKLSDPANKVLKDLAIREDEVTTIDDKIFRLKTLPYRTVQNVIDGVVITFEDITEQKHIEMMQKASENQLRTIVSSSEDIITLTDLDGKYLHFSGSRKYGLNPEEVVGKSIFDVLDAKTAKTVFQQIKTVVKKDTSKYDETTLEWQGKMEYFEDYRYPVKDNDGHIIAVGTIGRNITKRKKAELLLAKTEKRYKLALKNLPIIIAEFDLDLRYTWIYNPHPDFNEDSVIGKRDDDLAQNEGTTALVKMKKEVIKTGETKRKLITFSLSNQHHEYDIVIQPVFDIDGKITGATSAAFDITKI